MPNFHRDQDIGREVNTSTVIPVSGADFSIGVASIATAISDNTDRVEESIEYTHNVQRVLELILGQEVVPIE